MRPYQMVILDVDGGAMADAPAVRPYRSSLPRWRSCSRVIMKLLFQHLWRTKFSRIENGFGTNFHPVLVTGTLFSLLRFAVRNAVAIN